MDCDEAPDKRLVIAGAGTGKTTMLLNDAIQEAGEGRNVLYLTYTEANALEFKSAVIKRVGFVPTSITIMTWFSFLLVHGVRPFPAQNFTHRIDRMYFDEGETKPLANVKRGVERYYCPSHGIVYRSRLSDLAALCDHQWDGEVVNRICSIFDVILVDEGQDFAGYDFDILLSLMRGCSRMIIVGDPRQKTYQTNNGRKNSNFENVFDFFSSRSKYPIDKTSLCVTHRCPDNITRLANSLYPDLPEVKSSEDAPQGSIYKIKKSEFQEWARKYGKHFTILRYDRRTKVPEGYPVMNMGESKGLTLANVVIFPTKGMAKWIKNGSKGLKGMTRSKLYVAITRTSGDLTFVL